MSPRYANNKTPEERTPAAQETQSKDGTAAFPVQAAASTQHLRLQELMEQHEPVHQLKKVQQQADSHTRRSEVAQLAGLISGNLAQKTFEQDAPLQDQPLDNIANQPVQRQRGLKVGQQVYVRTMGGPEHGVITKILAEGAKYEVKLDLHPVPQTTDEFNVIPDPGHSGSPGIGVHSPSPSVSPPSVGDASGLGMPAPEQEEKKSAFDMKVTVGAQKHHPNYHFALPGREAPVKYDLDKWITKKSDPVAPPFLHKNPAVPAIVIELIKKWDPGHSLIDDLVAHLILDGPKTPKPGILETPANQEMFMHLMTMRANIDLRVNDIPNNCPMLVELTQTTKKATNKERVALGWMQILNASRELLKAQLLKGVPVPGKKEQVTFVDAALAEHRGPGFAVLFEKGLLSGNARSVKFKNGVVSGRGLDRGPTVLQILEPADDSIQFNFAINHLRFILYLEWRAVSELMGG